MAKVSIASMDRAAPASPEGCRVKGGTLRALFAGDGDPIHLHVCTLAAQGRLTLSALPGDRVGYVWLGSVAAGATDLTRGSSFIVERRGTGTFRAGDLGATVVIFAAAQLLANDRAGGNMHLLPADQVPRFRSDNGLTGAMHADATCPTCSAWLHENAFPPMTTASAAAAEAGVHRHSESEVIFIADGTIRLGQKLFGPGTAIAIAAGTMYSFTPGPQGLSFLNFRAERPHEIRFKDGKVIDEVAYWRERTRSPTYA